MREGTDINADIRRQVDAIRSSIASASSRQTIASCIEDLKKLKDIPGISSELLAMIDQAISDAGEKEKKVSTYYAQSSESDKTSAERRDKLNKEFEKALKDLVEIAEQCSRLVEDIKGKGQEYNELSQIIEANPFSAAAEEARQERMLVALDMAVKAMQLKNQAEDYEKKLEHFRNKQKEIEESKDHTTEEKKEALSGIQAVEELLKNNNKGLSEVVKMADHFKKVLLEQIATKASEDPGKQFDQQKYDRIMKQDLTEAEKREADVFIGIVSEMSPEQKGTQLKAFVEKFVEKALVELNQKEDEAKKTEPDKDHAKENRAQKPTWAEKIQGEKGRSNNGPNLH
jgi:hypothetical protein